MVNLSSSVYFIRALQILRAVSWPDRLNIDSMRIWLAERILRDMPGVDEDVVASVARLRSLLASDPSIHGSKKPEVGG